MIKNWSVNHFKSVYENTKLEMSPLTIFTGANSSGKSTIIQSLLLTTQTIQNNVHSKSLILNGHIIKLGNFQDILSNNQPSNEIEIGFEIEFNINDTREQRYLVHRLFDKSFENILVKCDFSFSANNEEDENDLSQLHPDLQESKISIFNIDDKNKEVESINIFRSESSPNERMMKLELEKCSVEEVSSLEYEVKLESNNNLANENIYIFPFYVKGETVGAKLLHFLPENLTTKYDEVQEGARRTVEFFIEVDNFSNIDAIDSSLPSFNQDFIDIILTEIKSEHLKIIKNQSAYTQLTLKRINERFDNLRNEFTYKNYYKFVRRLRGNSRKILLENLKNKETKLLKALISNSGPKYDLAQRPLPSYIEFAKKNIQRYFSRNVKYLGPLRDEPKPIYPHSGTTDSKDVGFRGEHTAAVLEIHKNNTIAYIPPKELENEMPQIHHGQLIDAVLDWLEYMGVVSDVKTIDRGKLGHELKVQLEGGNSFHDLTNVGVGVSQVLPILVLSLLAEQNSTLIFEQPELHLHPKVQTRLADFFVSMINLKKQCILETHSEYLINRLRYRSVTSNNDDISKDVIMYFVEQELGKSTYSPVRINKYGVIEEWPKGFFDEGEENAAAILKAAMSKRKKERFNND
jgi:predicted ATPase